MPVTIQSTATTTPLPNMRNPNNGRFIGRPNKPSIKQMVAMAQSISDSLNGWGTASRIRKIGTMIDVDSYAAVLRQIQQYDAYVDRGFATGVDRVGRRLEQTLNSFYTNTSRALDNIAQRPTTVRSLRRANQRPNQRRREDGQTPIKPVDVMSDLLMITRAYNTYWDTANKRIVVMTPEIIIKSPTVRGLQYNFGQILCHMSNVGNMPTFTAHTPRLSRNRRLCHPHINSDTMLCFGDGATAAERCRKQGRFFDVLEIVMSILQNYGSNPYDRLEEWNGICDKLVDPTTGGSLPIGSVVPPDPVTIVRCVSCASEVDQATLHNCERSNCRHNNSCVACVVRCGHQNCNIYVCHDHVMVCSHCGIRGCSQHFHAHRSTCDRCMGWQPGMPVTNTVTF